MAKESRNQDSGILGNLGSLVRGFLFRILSVGQIPQHIAFIMDGNRRYTKKWNLKEGVGHRVGFLALMSVLQYSYEMGVKYVTVYAFSIENFKRRPEEVQSLMDLIQEKIEALTKEESIVNQYGVRVYFIGNLQLLRKSVRLAAERAMEATAANSKAVLLICIAYTSTDEIVHAVQESCQEKWEELEARGPGENETDPSEEVVAVKDIEKHMYMAVAPDPDIVIRSSGETRLSNFLLWQTSYSNLYSPSALWPEIGFWHLFWAVLDYQRKFVYLDKRKKGVQVSL